jgi:hypothetical protein
MLGPSYPVKVKFLKPQSSEEVWREAVMTGGAALSQAYGSREGRYAWGAIGESPFD